MELYKESLIRDTKMEDYVLPYRGKGDTYYMPQGIKLNELR